MTTETALRAFHGDPANKQKVLDQLAEHRRLDQIVQGYYWASDEDGVFRGCAVGCLLHDRDGGHDRYETEFGIPEQLAWLEDSIFEALPAEVARLWPERFMGAINVDADLTRVWPRFAVWLMTDEKYGLANTTEAEDVKAVCPRIADAYARLGDGEAVTEKEADAISRAAWAAWDAWAAWAAWDARAARAAWAAWDARDAWAAWDARAARAARAAWDAWDARAARAAWDAWAARDEFVQASADKLIEILVTA